MQYLLLLCLSRLSRELEIQPRPEIRVQLRLGRYCVPDIAVWRAGAVGDSILTVRPFLVVEILSREDRMIRVQRKVQEYLGVGIENVWLIDPEEKSAWIYTPEQIGGSGAEVLLTEEPGIEIPLAELFRVKA